MRITRALSLIFLVLVLVSGAVTMASARHQMRAVGQTIVCTGYGITTITLDAHGNPVPAGPLILCPDCVPALAALTDATHPLAPAPTRAAPMHFGQRNVTPFAPDAPVHCHSRAPPVTA